jgi:hypothetical protein
MQDSAEEEADCSAWTVQNARAIFMEISDTSYLRLGSVGGKTCIVPTGLEAFRLSKNVGDEEWVGASVKVQ